MGLLDDAIREHLELKRQHGANPEEVARQEREALGPARAAAEPAAEPAEPAPDETAAVAASDELPAGEPGIAEEPSPGHEAGAPGYDEDPWLEEEPAPPPAESPPPAEDAGAEDVLEETPEFLQETPEHDRLWFEQKPPRDFDWDGQLPAYRFTWLDVFTATPMTGNGLAVVHDADALPDAVMHALARETKLSETSFLQSPDAGGADYRHRIWMPSGEIPFAGHPSLGAAAAFARARGESRATYVQQTEAGLQPVDVEIDGLLARVSMLQEPAQFGPELEPGDVLQTVGLEGDDADPALPAQVVSTGVEQLLVQLRSATALAGLLPDYDRIGALLRAHGAIVLYVSAVDAEAGTARARAFTGSAAIGEDPATGSAAGPLCALVAARAGVNALDIVQGEEMRRPSRLRAAMEGDRVRVGGEAVVVLEGTLHLDT